MSSGPTRGEGGVIRDIVHLNLNVSDIRTSLDFYRNVFLRSRTRRLETFYRKARQDLEILMEEDLMHLKLVLLILL